MAGGNGPRVARAPRFTRRFALTGREYCLVLEITTPRNGHYANTGLVELGAYEINKLREMPTIAFHP